MQRIDLDDVRFVECGLEVLERQGHAVPQCLGLGVRRRQGQLQRVLDRQQLLRKALDRVLVRLGDVVLGQPPGVVCLGFGAEPRVPEFAGFGFGTFELGRQVEAISCFVCG